MEQFKDALAMTRHYVEAIRNGRTQADIVKHLKSEQIELDEELTAETPGEDGIMGEAVDMILCLLDLIMIQPEKFTDEQIMAYMHKKLEKWKANYSESVTRANRNVVSG